MSNPHPKSLPSASVPVLIEQQGEVIEVCGAEEHLGLFQNHGDVGVVDAVVLVPGDVVSGGRVPASVTGTRKGNLMKGARKGGSEKGKL